MRKITILALLPDFGSYLKESPLSDAEKLVIAERETAILEEADQREESVIQKLRRYQELCHRAAQIIKPDTRNPQISKWLADYEATL